MTRPSNPIRPPWENGAGRADETFEGTGTTFTPPFPAPPAYVPIELPVREEPLLLEGAVAPVSIIRNLERLWSKVFWTNIVLLLTAAIVSADSLLALTSAVGAVMSFCSVIYAIWTE